MTSSEPDPITTANPLLGLLARPGMYRRAYIESTVSSIDSYVMYVLDSPHLVMTVTAEGLWMYADNRGNDSRCSDNITTEHQLNDMLAGSKLGHILSIYKIRVLDAVLTGVPMVTDYSKLFPTVNQRIAK